MLASAALRSAAVCCSSPSVVSAATLLAVVTALLALSRLAAAESVLLLPHLGLQVETRECGGWVRRQFVDAARVEAVVINESVSTTCVHFYLAVALRGEPRLLLLFAELQPRLEAIAGVYHEAAAALGISPSPTWPRHGLL